jgi:hypothetical protein
MKTTLAIMFTAIALSAPAVNHAHALQCDQDCRDYKTSHHLRNREFFIDMVFSDPRIAKAQAATDEACNRAAEAGYEVQKRDRDCKAAARDTQQAAWIVTVEIWRTTQDHVRNKPVPGMVPEGWSDVTKPGQERESEILIQLFTEAAHNNTDPWWFPAAE